MLGITFELLYLARGLVDVGEQATRGFAVEAGGGYKGVVTLFALRPRLRIKLSPIVPTLFGRIGGEMYAARAGIEGLAARLSLFAGGANILIGFDVRQCGPVLYSAMILFPKRVWSSSINPKLWRCRILSSTILIRAMAVMKSTLRISDSAKYFVSFIKSLSRNPEPITTK